MTEETLFHEVLAKPPSERAPFLAAACAGNPELRAAVEALLVAHEQSNLLDQPAVEATVDHQPRPADPDATAEFLLSANPQATLPEVGMGRGPITAGTILSGRYTLVEKLGEGGMGEVWVAQQTEPVKRRVALKLIKSGTDSRGVLSRFEQERQALAIMDHPNIARVLDGGLTPSGQPFFVMELVNGLPLTKFCDETQMNPRQRLELFVPICQAVQHAHQKGIVHRDLKPANILVTMIDGLPVPKVIDFGIAKATGGELAEEAMTQFGAVIGTLEYMAPEQAGYSGVDVDTRADIYSLGVILYELLTGLRPIDMKRLKKAGLAEMVRVIQEEEPARPSTRLSTDDALPSLAAVRQTEPKKLMALLRGELDWVVLKALEKDRNRRYDSAQGFARDIQRYLADEVVEARPPSRGYRLKKFVKRNKVQVLAAALVFLALVAGVVGTTMGMVRAEDAARAEANARGEAERARDGEKSQREKAEGLAAEKTELAARETKAKNDVLEANREKDKQVERNMAFLITARMDKVAQLRNTDPAAALDLLYDMETIPIDKRDMSWNLTVNALKRSQATVLTVPKSYNYTLSPDAKVLALARYVASPQEAVGSFIAFFDLATGKVRGATAEVPAQIAQLAYSPDSSKLVLTFKGPQPAENPGAPGKIQVYDVADPQKVVALDGHTAQVLALAFSPDGALLASGSADKTVHVWDLKTGRPVHVIKDHGAEVAGVTFTADGKYLATGGMDNTVRLWSVGEFQLVKSWSPSSTENGDGVTVLESSPDGKTILSGSDKGLIESRDIATGYVHWRTTVFKGRVSWLRFHRAGKIFFVRAANLTPWSAENGTRLPGQFPGTFYPERSLVVHVRETRCTIQDLDAQFEPVTLRAESKGGGRPVFNRDGTMLALASGGQILVWDVRTGQLRHTLTEPENSFMRFAAGPDARTLISWNKKEVRLWDLETGHTLWAGPIGKKPIGLVFPSSDGTTLVELWKALPRILPDKKEKPSEKFVKQGKPPEMFVRLWDVRTRLLRAEMTLSGWAGVVALNPIDNTLVTHSGRIRGGSAFSVWDLNTKQLVRTIRVDEIESTPLTMEINPDGKTFAILCSPDGLGSPATELFVWDLNTGELLHHERNGTTAQFGNTFVFSPDGKTVLTEKSGTVHFLDTITYRNRASFETHVTGPTGIAISPTGDHIATIGPSKVPGMVEVKLWDASRPEVVLTLGNRRDISDLSFSPDSKFLINERSNGTMTSWDLATGQRRTLYDPAYRHDPSVYRDRRAYRSPDRRYVLKSKGASDILGVLREGDDNPETARATIHVRDTRTNTLHEVEVGVGVIERITFSPDGTMAAFFHASTADGVRNMKCFVKVLSLADAKITATYPFGVAHTPDGVLVLGSSVHSGPLAFTPDGTTLAVASLDGKIVFINLAKGTVSEPLKTGASLGEDRRKSIVGIGFTKDGTRLVVQLGVVDQWLTMWDWRAGKPVTNEPIPDLFAKPDPSLSPDGRYRIRTSGSGTVEVIDLKAKPPEVVSQRRVP